MTPNIGIQNEIYGWLRMRPMRRAEICKKCNISIKEFRVNMSALRARKVVRLCRMTQYYEIA